VLVKPRYSTQKLIKKALRAALTILVEQRTKPKQKKMPNELVSYTRRLKDEIGQKLEWQKTL
jgi:hypothetical protein